VIDCEVWDRDASCWYLAGALYGLDDKPRCYYNASHQESDKCRPRMNHWHSWQGGECPLPEGLVVEVLRRGVPGNLTYDGYSGLLGWEHQLEMNSLSFRDIIAFKVTGTSNTHCMPGEIDQ